MATMSQKVKTPEHSSRSPKQKFAFSSPNIKARVQEKEELSDLNDRLATYIDCMRSLENQNAKLSLEISSSKESRSREISNVKAMFEAELSESRRMLDDVAKEKALLKLENGKLNGILIDLRPKLEQEQAANKRLQEKLRQVERRLSEKEHLLASVSSERLELQNRTKDLETQLDELEQKLAKDKEQLEKEILGRIDAENRYQTLKEEAQFTAQVHLKEVNEARYSSECESVKYNLDATDGGEYDLLLRDKLQELREEFEEEAENAKLELEDAYKLKFDELREQSERDRIMVSRLLEKQGGFKDEIDILKSDNNILSTKVEHFQKRILELDSLRAMDKDEFKHQLDDRDEKIKALQLKCDDLESEYESLLGIKIALDMELAAYNKLLEGEEQRLNITTQETKFSGSASRRGRKRGYRESEECHSKSSVECSATGNVSVADSDSCGKFVSITNNGPQEEDISGYTICRNVDGTEAAKSFIFPNDFILCPQQTVIIWSESHGIKPNPPGELVLDGDWLAGGNSISTTIVNVESKVVAQHKMTMLQSDADAPRKIRRRRNGNERESCIVM